MKITATAKYPNPPTWNGKSTLNKQLNCKRFKISKGYIHPEIYKRLKSGRKVIETYYWDDGWSVQITLEKGKKCKETSIQGYDALAENLIRHNQCCFTEELKDVKDNF